MAGGKGKFLIPHLISILIDIGIAMYMFDPILEAEYVERSIEEGTCKLHHVDEEREFQNSPSSRLKCLNVEASEAFRNKKEKNQR